LLILLYRSIVYILALFVCVAWGCN